jgi:6-phosphogluconolactonase
MFSQPELKILDDYQRLCEDVTQEILRLSNKKISKQDRFTIVLSGGLTPKGIYQRMAGTDYRDKFRWEKIHFFWSDERWVTFEDQESNYRMVSQALLTKVKIPSANIHPIQTEGCDIKDSARLYEKTIGDFFKLKKDELPRFDLILLGLGRDGHTSSLFPKNPALAVKDRFVTAVSEKGITKQRITLTLPIINHAEMIFFLVSGDEKAEIVHEVLDNENRNVFPADEIRPDRGKTCWFLDKAAARRLERKDA